MSGGRVPVDSKVVEAIAYRIYESGDLERFTDCIFEPQNESILDPTKRLVAAVLTELSTINKENLRGIFQVRP